MLSLLNVEYWFLQTIAMAITALIIPRLNVTSLFGAFSTVLTLAFVNANIWSAALFFSIPDTFSFHALTLILANGIVFWILVKILPGIEVDGIVPALIAPVVFTVTSALVYQYGTKVEWIELGKKTIGVIGDVKDNLESPKKTTKKKM